MNVPDKHDSKYKEFKASPGVHKLIKDLYDLIYDWMKHMTEIIELPSVQKTRGDGKTFWTIIRDTLVDKDKQIKELEGDNKRITKDVLEYSQANNLLKKSNIFLSNKIEELEIENANLRTNTFD